MMNLTESKIIDVYSETDVTELYKIKVGEQPHEALIKVDMLVDSYGVVERKTKNFFETDWKLSKERGFYLG